MGKIHIGEDNFLKKSSKIGISSEKNEVESDFSVFHILTVWSLVLEIF